MTRRAGPGPRATPRPRSLRAFATLLIVLTSAGCVDFFLAPDPARDPATVFESLWGEYDAYYASFGIKGIDWDSVYDEYRPQVRPGMSFVELGDLLGRMVLGLRDGHATLETPYGRYAYTGWYDVYPENYDQALAWSYVAARPPGKGGTPPLIQGAGLSYGWVTDRIGYIGIRSFHNPAVRHGIDDALAMLADVDGLILDLRSNGGGSDRNAEAVAARLAHERYLYRRVVYRNGPSHDDFTEPIDDYIEPYGEHRFTGPLAVLTNRRVYSAAESFVLALRPRPHTVQVGDTTGGGSGNPLGRELPNGWVFQVPRWIEYDPHGETYEDVGLGPDVFIQLVPGSGRDAILERAIEELRGGTAR